MNMFRCIHITTNTYQPVHVLNVLISSDLQPVSQPPPEKEEAKPKGRGLIGMRAKPAEGINYSQCMHH